jgi:hypothetical protein
MTAARLTFEVLDSGDLIAGGFDQIKIERDSGAGFVELSRATTRIPLHANVEKYVYSDPTWDESAVVPYEYRAIFFNSVDEVSGTSVAITDIVADRYTTLEAIRAEGVLEADVSDATVLASIDLADRYIEKVTGQWFSPRYCQFALDGKNETQLFVDAPIIAVLEMKSCDTTVSTDGIIINNRHLTAGMLTPDDRQNPSIRTDCGNSYLNPLQCLFSPSYYEGNQNVTVRGIFGYTDLTRGSIPGETSAGSQVPLDYGETPDLIEWCSKMITITKVYPALSDKTVAINLMDRLKRQKTKHQEIEFNSASSSSESSSSATFAMSKAVDMILEGFTKPIQMRFV